MHFNTSPQISDETILILPLLLKRCFLTAELNCRRNPITFYSGLTESVVDASTGGVCIYATTGIHCFVMFLCATTDIKH